jgi:predicted SnoaL-like aldol condensation-catalyzing enzyme
MSVEDNKTVVRRFFDEVVNGRDLDSASEFVTSDYVEHQNPPAAEGAEESRSPRASSP